MNNNLRNKSKSKGIKKIIDSTKYSLQGLSYALRNERSIILYLMLSFLTIIIAIFLKITTSQWIAIILSLGVILTVELINTAIEATVDMVTTEYNKLAKIAKDCGSAATFVASMFALVIVLVIFISRISTFF